MSGDGGFWWNEGHTKITPDDFIGRIRGYISLSAGAVGYLDITNVASGELVFAMMTVQTAGGEGSLSISGNRINWQLASGVSGHICYGVY